MAGLWRWTVVFTLLIFAGSRLWAASPTEKGLFNSAAEALRDGFYPQAEQGFSQFVQQFTNSQRISEAVLLQAQAQLKQTNYAGAIELLSQREPLAGKLADEYIFWLGEAQFQKGEFKSAAETFARLVSKFPASSRCLQAVISEASARARLDEWQQIIKSLQQSEGPFQAAVRGGATNDLVVRGFLLLSDAQFHEKDYDSAEKTLGMLSRASLNPELAWQSQYLLSRILSGGGRIEDALRNSTNLNSLAMKAGKASFQAETASFHAGLFEQVKRPDEAIALYSQNLKDGVPLNKQGEALLKVTELFLAQNKIPQAAQTLERFCTNYPAATNADFALLSLGELRLRQYATLSETNVGEPNSTNTIPLTTNNYLGQAIAALSTLITNHPGSSLIGEAYLNLGWCYWLGTNM